MKNGEFTWKPDYKYRKWDVDNLGFLWTKAINDVLTELGLWGDDDAMTVGGVSTVHVPINDINKRKLVYKVKEM